MNLIATKVAVLFLLGFIKLVSGLLPLLFQRVLKQGKMKWIESIMAGVMCFGGGVLLSTVFIHMLPEVRECIKQVMLSEHADPDMYPFAELILCGGFFIIYFIEAIVHNLFNVQHSHGIPQGHSHATAPSIVSDIKSEIMKNGQVNPVFVDDNHAHTVTGLPNRILHPDDLNRNTHKKYECATPKKFTVFGHSDKSVSYSTSPTLTSYISFSSEYDSIDDVGKHENGISSSKTTFPTSKATKEEMKTKTTPALTSGAKEKKLLASVRSFIIVIALSIHSVFEGMAIGLQGTEADVWKLFAAVVIHECAILFCVGNEMVQSKINNFRIVSYMVTLSFVTPIGIVIGIVLTSESSPHGLVIGIMQGLSGGTLLYATFFEVLEREKLAKVGMTGMLGAMLLLIGFVAMAGLEATGGHSHGGGDTMDTDVTAVLASHVDDDDDHSHHGHSHFH